MSFTSTGWTDLGLLPERTLVHRLGRRLGVDRNRRNLPELFVEFVAVLNAYSELNRCDKQKLCQLKDAQRQSYYKHDRLVMTSWCCLWCTKTRTVATCLLRQPLLYDYTRRWNIWYNQQRKAATTNENTFMELCFLLLRCNELGLLRYLVGWECLVASLGLAIGK